MAKHISRTVTLYCQDYTMSDGEVKTVETVKEGRAQTAFFDSFGEVFASVTGRKVVSTSPVYEIKAFMKLPLEEFIGIASRTEFADEETEEVEA